MRNTLAYFDDVFVEGRRALRRPPGRPAEADLHGSRGACPGHAWEWDCQTGDILVDVPERA